jgi:type I restriction enzyme S subunit
LGEVFTLQAGKNITANKISEHKNDKEPFPCYGGNGIRGYVSNYNRDGLHPIIGRQGALCGNINVARGKFYATEHAVVVDLYATTDSSWATYALIQMNLNQYATATAQPGLSVSTINDAYIVIPPLGEQKRIAKKLDDIFCFIDKIDSQATDLFFEVKAVKAKILDLAIRGKLVPQDPNDEPSIEMLKRLNPDFVASDTSHYPFEIPGTWSWAPMSCIFDMNPKNNLADEVECGFVPMNDVSDGYSGQHTFETREWSQVKKGYCHFQDGDLAVAKISPCFENKKSTIFQQLPNGVGAGTTELVILRSKGVYTKFYLYLVKSLWYEHEGTKYFKGVVGQQRVNKSIFTTLDVPVPPLAEQKRIVNQIEKLLSVIDSISLQLV